MHANINYRLQALSHKRLVGQHIGEAVLLADQARQGEISFQVVVAGLRDAGQVTKPNPNLL
jgi:hypothetical protein